MVFLSKFPRKWQIGLSEPYFGEVMGDAWPWLVARWKSHGRLSVRVYWTFFLSITVPELWGEMCTARVFSRGVDLFALKFYLDRVFPINRSWYQKTRDTALPDDEDRILLRSLVLTQYRTDRQTDGRICRSYSAVHARLAAQCPTAVRRWRMQWHHQSHTSCVTQLLTVLQSQPLSFTRYTGCIYVREAASIPWVVRLSWLENVNARPLFSGRFSPV